MPKSGVERAVDREELVCALRQAMTIELASMLQYLYAAYSVPTRQAGLAAVRSGDWTPKQLALACGDGGASAGEGMRGTLLRAARDEMTHFLIVNHVLMAVGEPFHLPAIDFGAINGEVPVPLDLALEAFGIGSAHRFAEVERTGGVTGAMEFAERSRDGERTGWGHSSLGELYAGIRAGLRRIRGPFPVSGRWGERFSFRCGHQPSVVDDLTSALFAIDAVTGSAEGIGHRAEETHHAVFLRLTRLLAADPTWRPAYPVLRNPTLHAGDRAREQVTDPYARRVMGLFNDAYSMMLWLMAARFGARADPRLPYLRDAVDVLTGVMRPLAELLVTMPSGRQGRTAGPSFELDLQPGPPACPDIAARTTALGFDDIAREAAECPLIPNGVAELSARLGEHYKGGEAV